MVTLYRSGWGLDLKTCDTCNTPKARTSFANFQANKDGLRDTCKLCARRRGRENKSSIDVCVNVFDWVEKYGDEEEFEPRETTDCCLSPAGSEAKVEVLKQRVLRGESLWHEDDVVTWERFDQTKVRRSHEKEGRAAYTPRTYKVKLMRSCTRFEEDV